MTTDTAPATSFTQRTATAGGLSLRLTEAGDGPPVLAVGAGFAGSEAHTLLAAALRVVTVEPDGVATPQQVGAALATLSADLGAGTIGLVGVGEGAAAATWAAVETGERATALVLVSPAGITPPARGAAADDGALGDAGLTARLAQSPAAKLVLLGTEDRSLPPDTAGRFRAGLSRCHIVFVYAAGADITGQRPGAFAEVAGDFLARGEQFVVGKDSLIRNP